MVHLYLITSSTVTFDDDTHLGDILVGYVPVKEYYRRRNKLRMAVISPIPDPDREEQFMTRLANEFPDIYMRTAERIPPRFRWTMRWFQFYK